MITKIIFTIGILMIVAGTVGLVIVITNLQGSDCDGASTIIFLHNNSFSGIQQIHPGYDIIINFDNDTTITHVKDNYSVTYIITSDGFTNATQSGD